MAAYGAPPVPMPTGLLNFLPAGKYASKVALLHSGRSLAAWSSRKPRGRSRAHSRGWISSVAPWSAVSLEGEVHAHLAGDEGVPEARESQQEAARLGISGVPFYVFDGRYGLSGAQPVGIFLRMLEKVRAERAS